jgi:hypothetical protein
MVPDRIIIALARRDHPADVQLPENQKRAGLFQPDTLIQTA